MMSQRAKGLSEQFTGFNNDLIAFVENSIIHSGADHFDNIKSAIS
jgi:hypothetical protein